MNYKNIKYIFLSLVIIVMSSCDFIAKSSNNSSDDKKDFMLIRYDRLLKEYIQFNSLSALQKINSTYLPITQVLFEEVLALGSFTDDSVSYKLKSYYSDPTLLQLMNDVSNKFPELTYFEKKLERGFKVLEKNIENFRVPQVYTQVSALNESIIVTDTLLGISLDKYMGQKYPLYQRFYYDYQTQLMNPEQMLSDCFIFYLISEYPLSLYGRTLLDVMIYYGKIYYIVSEVLKDTPIEDMLGYSQDELKWCKDNKALLWTFMLKNNQLHSTDPMLIREYIRPIPTGIYHDESPLLLGIWMGTQLVKEYMSNNKDTTWTELLEFDNSGYFLEESRFHPE